MNPSDNEQGAEDRHRAREKPSRQVTIGFFILVLIDWEC